MENKLTYTIDGYEGVWTLDSSSVSELGFLMAKFYHEERGVWMSVNMGKFNDLIVAGTKANKLTITSNGI